MDVEVTFENEDRHGIVAAGTYLFDAAKRLGIYPEADCERRGECDSCKMKVTQGKNHLSEPTKAELKILDAEQLIQGYRLACQTKFVEQGEVKIMTEKRKEPEKTEEEKAREADQKISDDFRKKFEKLSLEDKMVELVELERIAFGETVSFVMNSPYKLVDKIMDVMADFGLKMEKDQKEQKRPAEHKPETTSETVQDEEKPKKTPRKKTGNAKKVKPDDESA